MGIAELQGVVCQLFCLISLVAVGVILKKVKFEIATTLHSIILIIVLFTLWIDFKILVVVLVNENKNTDKCICHLNQDVKGNANRNSSHVKLKQLQFNVLRDDDVFSILGGKSKEKTGEAVKSVLGSAEKCLTQL